MDFIWSKLIESFWWLVQTSIVSVPLPIWIVVGGVALGYLYKRVGLQGLLGGLAAAALVFSYGKGWKDRDAYGRASKEPTAPSPTTVKLPEPKPKPTKKKRTTLIDMLGSKR